MSLQGKKRIYEALPGSLWGKLFKIFELHPAFTQLLCRVREEKHSLDDISKFDL